MVLMSLLFVVASYSSVYAHTKPKLSGHTFTSEYGETLDFYDDYVIYKAEGADSRKGDWKLGSITNIGSPMYCEITINIYISDRMVTMKGRVEYYRDGELLRLKLSNGRDSSTWKFSY